jgi:CRISPR system Cascade subunit CasE
MTLHLTRASVPHEIVARPWKDGGFRDSYAWHKRIWECFPERPKAARDFLTRLDDTGNGIRLLILSASAPTKPDWCPHAVWETKPVADSFLTHSRFRFSLLANPTKKVRSNAKGELLKNSRRVPLSQREDLLAWLERKGIQHGFSINLEEIQTIPRPRQAFLKAGTAGLHSATEFIGSLHVTDPKAFHHALEAGIGSAKAFGFGLLCLSPF